MVVKELIFIDIRYLYWPQEVQRKKKYVWPTRKTVVTMRLDADLLARFRQQRGYQTRINAILCLYEGARVQ